MKKTIPKKIFLLDTLAKKIDEARKEKKRIVLCHGVFDLLHPGHIRHLQSAKKYGDILVVTLTADKFVKKGPGRPVFNENLRAEVLASLSVVDYVGVIHAESSIDALKKIKPDFYVKGPDYRNRKVNPNIPVKLDLEKKTVESLGGKIVFTDDDIIFSSSNLINTYLDSYPKATQSYLKIMHQSYVSQNIIDHLSRLKDKKILVIGDAIIDQYHYTLPMGKSSKEPIVVHRYRKEESFAGGTLATANHIASVSDHVTLVTLLGKKESFVGFIRQHLHPTVKPIFYYQNDARTIVKRRYIDEGSNQKLFQISYMKDEKISLTSEVKILNYLRHNISNFDLVVVNDFGHGLITDRIIRLVCKKSKYLTLNVQANSANYGFNVITKYPRAEFVCIDEHELRLATHDRHSDIVKLAKRIGKKMRCLELIVTRGWEGSISVAQGGSIVEAPALAQVVVDRVGAGDAFFSIAGPCAYIGMDQQLVSFVGNVAGAIKVASVGHKSPLEFRDITKFITRLLK